MSLERTDNTGEMYNIVFNASKSKCIIVNARRKLAICSTLNCNLSFSIGGNSIEVVDEWLHLGHMISIHFTDDTDITLCKNRLIGNV